MKCINLISTRLQDEWGREMPQLAPHTQVSRARLHCWVLTASIPTASMLSPPIVIHNVTPMRAAGLAPIASQTSPLGGIRFPGALGIICFFNDIAISQHRPDTTQGWAVAISQHQTPAQGRSLTHSQFLTVGNAYGVLVVFLQSSRH